MPVQYRIQNTRAHTYNSPKYHAFEIHLSIPPFGISASFTSIDAIRFVLQIIWKPLDTSLQLIYTWTSTYTRIYRCGGLCACVCMHCFHFRWAFFLLLVNQFITLNTVTALLIGVICSDIIYPEKKNAARVSPISYGLYSLRNKKQASINYDFILNNRH